MDPPPIITTTSKLRLMCSYGGHIVPRPRSNSLCYVGGDTKIICLNPTTTTTLSSLTALLSSTLSVSFPFTLKYLFPPHHDLSSLIPLASDPDLLFFLHHLHGLSSSSSSTTSSRIRLFIFPPSVIRHPKTEVWFCDALKSAKIMHRAVGGRDADGKAQSESLSGGDFSSGGASSAESIALETGSSFGSASSSASSSNLTSLNAQVEDANGGGNLQDNKVALLSSDSFASDNGITSAISLPLAATCQDPVVHVSLLENCLSRKPLESESKISVSSSRVHAISGFPLPLQVNQLQQQQVQFVQVGANYIPHNTEGVVPVSPYYPVYQAQPQLQLHYQPNQVCPVYFVPFGQMAPYDLPGQCGLVNTVTAAYQPPMHSNASLVAPQVAYKEATVAPAKPDLASKVCRSGQAQVATPHVRDHHDQNQKQLPQMRHQPQSIPIPSRESANFSNELDDDPACFQIYKSQPPPPF